MKKVFTIFLLASLTMAAQNVSPPDTLVWLKAPVGKASKAKTITLKTTGEELAAHAFTTIQEHVSLISNVPAGHMGSLTLYFNSGLINLNKKEFGVEYQDTNLRLVVYDVGIDGRPGNLLTPVPLYFTVTKDHRGALELDLSALKLTTRPQLFIGMAATDNHTAEQVILKVRENKNALSFIKAKGSNQWTEYSDGTGFKFDIKMRVGVVVE
jgi:hypothetical protein